MGWCTDYFEKIRKRPSLYIGGDSVLNLSSFMLGYMSARSDLGLEEFDDESDAVFLDGFRQWLVVKFQDKSSLNWEGLIEKVFDQYSDTSINAFYVLLDEYKRYLTVTTLEAIKKDYEEFIGYKDA